MVQQRNVKAANMNKKDFVHDWNGVNTLFYIHVSLQWNKLFVASSDLLPYTPMLFLKLIARWPNHKYIRLNLLCIEN